MEEPRTPQEWQDAVDAAQDALALDAARQFGLIKDGPAVNVSRCEDMLRRGKRRGVIPALNAIDRFANGLLLTSKSLLF